jgi:hypothetical protein
MDELNKILNKIKSLNGQIKNITLKLQSYKHTQTKRKKKTTIKS